MIIYLSPSTQENNVGVNGYGTEEQRMNQLCDILEKHLQSYGHICYRNEPELSLSEVVAESNGVSPELHLALHSNANNGQSRGCLVFCHKFGGVGEQFARAIYNKLSAITPSSDFGVIQGFNYYGEGKPLYELAYTNAPAVLVEVAFHDNAIDAQWIMANMTAIATVITSAINEVAGIPMYEDYKILYEKLKNDIISLMQKYGG